MMVKKVIKKIYEKIYGIPYDWMKYYKKMAKRNYLFSAASKNEESIEWVVTKLRILTHEIDKGLAMKNPRPGFGREKIIFMMHLLEKYLEFNQLNYEYDAYLDAVEILEKYIENKDNYMLDISMIDLKKYPRDYSKLNNRLASNKDYEKCGSDVFDFKQFAQNRHSIRAYKDDTVISDKMFEEIIKVARTAPSACNRQSIHAFLINDRELAKKVLEIQGGNRGFYGANNCIIVMADMNSYWYDGEMNTAFIDGGLFMMNLIYSLKYYGLDSCPLIWDDYSERRDKINEIINIESNMLIIGILTVGNAEDDAKILCSPRKDTINIIVKEGGYSS